MAHLVPPSARVCIVMVVISIFMVGYGNAGDEGGFWSAVELLFF